MSIGHPSPVKYRIHNRNTTPFPWVIPQCKGAKCSMNTCPRGSINILSEILTRFSVLAVGEIVANIVQFPPSFDTLVGKVCEEYHQVLGAVIVDAVSAVKTDFDTVERFQ